MNSSIIKSFNSMSTPRIGEPEMYMDYTYVNLPKVLINYIDCLIEWNTSGKNLTVDSLSSSDKKHFIANIIKFKISEGEGWDWLMDSSNRDNIANLFCDYILQYGDKKRQECLDDFLFEMIDSACTEFNDLMQHLIDIRISYRKSDETSELLSSGFIKVQHDDNGEIDYVKARKAA